MAATEEMLQEYGRRNPDKAPLINEALSRGKDPQWIADRLFQKMPAPKPSEKIVPPESIHGGITAPFGSVSTKEGVQSDVQSGGMPLTTQPFTDPSQGVDLVTPQDTTATMLGAAFVAAGMPQFAPLAAGLSGALLSLPQGQQAAVKEGLIQALNESPSAFISYINKTQPLLKGMVDEEGAAVLKVFGESGDVPSLELTTGGAWSKWIADVAEGALFAKKMEKYRGKILPKQIERAAQKTLDKIFASPIGEVRKGGIVSGAQEIADDIGKSIGDEFFKGVWDKADEIGRTISLEQFENSIGMSRFIGATGNVLDKPTLYRTAAGKMGDTPLGRIMGDVASLYEDFGDAIPLKEADNLLQRIGKELGQAKDRTAKSLLTQAKNSLRENIKSNMIDVSIPLGGGRTTTLWDRYQNARSFWGEFSNEFRNDFVDKAIVKLAKENPEFVADKAFVRGRVSDMARLKKVLSSSPEAFEAIQRAHMEKVITRGALNKMSTIPPGTTALEHLTGLSQEQIAIAYTKPQREALNNFAMALHRATQPAGQGKMLVQLTQGGAALALVSGGLLTDREGTGVTGAIIVLGAPAVLGRMFTNPNTVKLLTQGLRTPRMQAGSSIANRILSNYIAESADEKWGNMINKKMEEFGIKPVVELQVKPLNANERMELVKP